MGTDVRPMVWRAEAAIAVTLFAVAFAAFVSSRPLVGGTSERAAVVILFVLLVGAYLAFSVRAVPLALRRMMQRDLLRALVGPAVLLVVCVLYLRMAGFAAGARAGALAAYLVLPALITAARPTPAGRPPVRDLAVIALLWLPIELHLLPSLPLPVSGGYDALPILALVEGLYLFLVARPLDGVGYTFLLTRRDVTRAVVAFAAYAVVAIPIGFATHFITWNPTGDAGRWLVRTTLIYLVTALPEEFLFRGLIQNLLTRWLGPTRALPIASVVFGLAHLPDPRYALLATLAGLAYGWTYLRTGKITASAVTHAVVDGVWGAVLRQ
jgi:membrane protease YdiL (CAAX protease family)